MNEFKILTTTWSREMVQHLCCSTILISAEKVSNPLTSNTHQNFDKRILSSINPTCKIPLNILFQGCASPLYSRLRNRDRLPTHYIIIQSVDYAITTRTINVNNAELRLFSSCNEFNEVNNNGFSGSLLILSKEPIDQLNTVILYSK